jgi:cell division transport system permease protein
MKGSDEIAERFARGQTGEDRPALQRQGFFGRLRSEPLLPEAGAGGAPLTAAIGVMSFLAALALAALLAIFAAADAWTSELKSGITIQIKGPDAVSIKAAADATLAVLQSTDGIEDARALTPEETARLLEPWLGKGNVGAYLNVPALIEARAAPELQRDLSGLKARVSAAAPTAVFDDHSAWRDRLSAAAWSGQALAVAVFVLILGGAAAVSAFAARAGLAANREVISILHLVGATDAFIANEVQRRFLILALRGSIAGVLLAALALGLAGFALKAAGGPGDFVPGLKAGPGLWSAMLVVPLSLCLATAVTARLTVLGTLGREL